MKILHRYWPSMVTLAAVLWLTLAPQPLPDLDVPPFDGLDKVMHAIMRGGLAGAFMFDWRRGGRWNLRKSNAGRQHMLTPGVVIIICLCMAVFSAVDEWAQGALGMGRTSDVYDLIADIVGIVVAALTAPAAINALLEGRRAHRP